MREVIDIHEIGREGQGVGFDAARNIYFVTGALPGDRAEIDFPETSKRYRDATLVRLIEPAKTRVESPCEHFSFCGGCDWLNWSYSAQIEAKERIVRHAVERAGGKEAEIRPILASKNPLGYRARIQVRREGGKVGFLKRASGELIDIQNCIVARPEVNEALKKLREEPKNNEREKIELSLVVSELETKVETTRNAPHAAKGFTQVNPEMNECLKTEVGRLLAECGSKDVLELFCGDGNFTFSYLSQVGSVVGVDSNGSSIDKANRRLASLAEAEKSKARFIQGPVASSTVRKLPRGFVDACDTLIVDPPRIGAGEALRDFLGQKLGTILYVSCSALTFSQDAKLLFDEGFRLSTVQPLDMFPQTRHVELVACFRRAR